MFDLFGKNKNICMPADGKCIKLEEVPDEVFSAKLLGDGFAVIPSKAEICAPIEGKIQMLADTKHAFGIKSKSGAEVLVHVGLDTVDLKGQGFTTHKSVGDSVKPGDVIISFDEQIMKDNDKNMVTMVIVTSNGGQALDISVYNNDLNAGDVVADFK